MSPHVPQEKVCLFFMKVCTNTETLNAYHGWYMRPWRKKITYSHSGLCAALKIQNFLKEKKCWKKNNFQRPQCQCCN